MKEQRVRITIEFKRPGDGQPSPVSLSRIIDLVTMQMRETPRWDNSSGTGYLNTVRHDSSLQVTDAHFITVDKG